MSERFENPETEPEQTPPPEPLDRRYPALGRLAFSRRRTIPHIQQTTSSDCGAASLAMVVDV